MLPSPPPTRRPRPRLQIPKGATTVAPPHLQRPLSPRVHSCSHDAGAWRQRSGAVGGILQPQRILAASFRERARLTPARVRKLNTPVRRRPLRRSSGSQPAPASQAKTLPIHLDLTSTRAWGGGQSWSKTASKIPRRRQQNTGNPKQLPDPAPRRMHHRLACLAAERLLELRHVRHHVVHPQLWDRVRICQHHRPDHLGSRLVAPRVAIRQEEALQVGQPVRIFIGECLALFCEVLDQRRQRQIHAAIVRRVLTPGSAFHPAARRKPRAPDPCIPSPRRRRAGRTPWCLPQSTVAQIALHVELAA